MPEVLRTWGYRFFFFSREANEPRHIHVEHAEKYAKFWLEPIELAESRVTALRRMVIEYRDEFIAAWDEHLNR